MLGKRTHALLGKQGSGGANPAVKAPALKGTQQGQSVRAAWGQTRAHETIAVAPWPLAFARPLIRQKKRQALLLQAPLGASLPPFLISQKRCPCRPLLACLIHSSPGARSTTLQV